MRLLVFMQAIDTEDPVHSFMHAWVAGFAARFDTVHVVCLKEGTHHLPENVTVHSLGKEGGRSRLKYLWRFYRYAWGLRREYDVVFVHMNDEYAVLGGLLWKLLSKPLFLWRNHYHGGMLTDIAARLSRRVFYTSRYSYTARFPHAVRMPVGVDIDAFAPAAADAREQGSILFLARISPSKRLEVFIEALTLLKARGVSYTADVYGSPLPQDAEYLAVQQERAARAGLPVSFHPGIKNTQAPRVYASHEFSVNASRSGMYDKTIFEAAACGCIPVASSLDYAAEADARVVFPDNDAAGLADRIAALLALRLEEKERLREASMRLAHENDLAALMERLRDIIVNI